EVAELDELGRLGIDGSEPGQGLVEGEQVLAGFRDGHLFGDSVEVAPGEVAAAFAPTLAAGILNQDAAHGLGSRGEEVAAAVPVVATGVADKAEVGLVDQGGGLEGLPRRLVSQAVGG